MHAATVIIGPFVVKFRNSFFNDGTHDSLIGLMENYYDGCACAQ